MEILEGLKLVVNQLGSSKDGTSSIMTAVGQWFGETGGLNQIVEKLKEHGLGDVVNSWLSQGENLPVTTEQIQKVLGSDAVAKLSAKMGIDPADVGKHLSEILPALVSKLNSGEKNVSQSA
jgi:uncharacterized protein YidB (DUF937 family)